MVRALVVVLVTMAVVADVRGQTVASYSPDPLKLTAGGAAERRR
jgi:hypothetical protein